MDFFKFLGKTAQDFASGVGGVFKATGDVAAKTGEVGFNFLKSLPKAAEDYSKGVGGALQGFARTPEQVVRTVSQPLVDVVKPGASASQQDKNTGLRGLLYGEEPVQTYYDVAKGGGEQLAKLTGNKDFAKYSIFGAPLLAGLDLSTGGKGKAAESVVSQLVKDGTESAVKKTLAGKLPQEIIDKVAPSIALTKDTNVIGSIIDREVSKTPPPQVITRAPSESPELSSLVKSGKIENQTQMVPINSLKLGSDTAGSFDKSTIKGYVNDIKNQKTIDPLVVSEKDGQTFVQDGKHRLIAMKQAGIQEVPVVKQVPKKTLPVNGAALQASLSKTPALVPARAATIANPTTIAEATIPKVEQTADPLNEISNAINGAPGNKGLASISRENAQSLSQQRGQRFAASEAAGKTSEGSPGYFKELSQLKGEYAKTKVGGMIENIGPDRAEQLFSGARAKIQSVPDKVYQDLGYFPKSARLNTQTALRKVIFGEGGGVPTKSEIKLIRTIAPKLADNIESKIPKQRKLLDLAAQIAGVPRALQSSFDLSMGGRQGLLVAARHPVIWARANKESVKYLKSDKYFNSQMEAIRKTPEYELGAKYGLATPAATKGSEEAYASSQLAEKIPIAGRGIKASERAYEGGLTKLRSDLWSQTLKAYGGVDTVESKLGPKGMQDLAEAINTLTGRGGKKGGFTAKHMTTLAETLFAPRLWAARLNTLNPAYYARLSPAARKVALQNAGSFAAVASVVLGAAAALGGQVETDPKSSDFLKIKFGDTRYDIFGGLQQNIVFAWREITGEKKSTQTGETTKFAKNIGDILTGKSNQEAGVDTSIGSANRLSVAGDLFTNKLAPIPAAVVTQLEGKDRGGNEINPAAEIAKLFIPINLTGISDTTQDTGSLAQGVGLNIPGFFGIGAQTYGTPTINLSDKQKAVIQKLQDSGAPAKQIEATTRFYQTMKTVPDRNKASQAVNDALAAGDKEKAIQAAKDYNSKYAAAFKDWVSKYGDYTSDKSLVKEYSSGKITLTASSIRQRLKNIKSDPRYSGK